MRRFKSVVEQALANRPGLKEISAVTFRQDSAVILESLLPAHSEADIAEAMDRQGFKGKACLPTIRALRNIGLDRRLLRNQK
ncbi:MAG: hypothetical protein H7A46_26385 [Verrucomicrobiales bacterium]|nr:hypothetical protein [Verrucomicrobiales bacterium]